MKDFNLEEAKAGKPVCTRDGKPARIICFDKRDSSTPIVALIKMEDNKESLFCYPNNGKFVNDTIPHYDLMMASVKHEGWVSLYKFKGDKEIFAGQVYDNEEDAKNDDFNEEQFDYIATTKIEWED